MNDIVHAPLFPAAAAFFVLFLAVSALELVFCFRELERPRKITKPFCVLLLALAFLFARPEAYLVYVGLVLGAIGDLLLVFKHKVWTFVGGTLAFLFGHICYCVAYLRLLPSIGIPVYAAVFVCFVLVPIAAFFALRKAIKTPGLFAGGIVYFSFIVLDFALSIVALCVMKNPILWLNVVGMSIFLVSDVYLVKTLFVKDDKRRDFYIMSTYLVAQCLLALGFVLIP